MNVEQQRDSTSTSTNTSNNNYKSPGSIADSQEQEICPVERLAMINQMITAQVEAIRVALYAFWPHAFRNFPKSNRDKGQICQHWI